MALRSLLTTHNFSAFNKFEMIAHSVVEGFVSGFHKSPYKGFAIEFAEHREYVPGDDLKHLDWKIYARSNRHYIKQYEEDTALSAYLLLDRSGSMGYKSGEFSKLDFGKFISGVFSYILLQQSDSIGMMSFDAELNDYIPPGSTKPHFKRIIDCLDEMEPGADTGIGPVLQTLARKLKRRALIVIISDFYDDYKAIDLALNHFAHKKHEVVVFQVMDRREVDFSFSDLTRFECLESDNNLLVDPIRLKKEYLQQFTAHQEAIRRTCYQLHIDYVPMVTDEPFEKAMARYLAGRLRR